MSYVYTHISLGKRIDRRHTTSHDSLEIVRHGAYASQHYHDNSQRSQHVEILGINEVNHVTALQVLIVFRSIADAKHSKRPIETKVP